MDFTEHWVDSGFTFLNTTDNRNPAPMADQPPAQASTPAISTTTARKSRAKRAAPRTPTCSQPKKSKRGRKIELSELLSDTELLGDQPQRRITRSSDSPDASQAGSSSSIAIPKHAAEVITNRLERRRERNRVAAKKSRERRMEQVLTLEGQLIQSKQELAFMAAKYHKAIEEVMKLRQMLGMQGSSAGLPTGANGVGTSTSASLTQYAEQPYDTTSKVLLQNQQRDLDEILAQDTRHRTLSEVNELLQIVGMAQEQQLDATQGGTLGLESFIRTPIPSPALNQTALPIDWMSTAHFTPQQSQPSNVPYESQQNSEAGVIMVSPRLSRVEKELKDLLENIPSDSGDDLTPMSGRVKDATGRFKSSRIRKKSQ